MKKSRKVGKTYDGTNVESLGQCRPTSRSERLVKEAFVMKGAFEINIS